MATVSTDSVPALGSVKNGKTRKSQKSRKSDGIRRISPKKQRKAAFKQLWQRVQLGSWCIIDGTSHISQLVACRTATRGVRLDRSVGDSNCKSPTDWFEAVRSDTSRSGPAGHQLADMARPVNYTTGSELNVAKEAADSTDSLDRFARQSRSTDCSTEMIQQ